MQGKYKFIIFLLFLANFIYGQEEKRNITFILNSDNVLTERTRNGVEYLIDFAETKLLEDFKDIAVKNVRGEVDPFYIKKVINYVFSHGLNGFYYIRPVEDDNSTDIEITLYSAIGNVLYEDKIIVYDTMKSDKYFNETIKTKWLDIIYDSIKLISLGKSKSFGAKSSRRSAAKLEHDFPFFSFSFSGISAKFYFDERMVSWTQKSFSVFPIRSRLTFYPLKYFELGLFIDFYYDNVVYRYYDLSQEEYGYYDSDFLMNYGFFVGLSFFNDSNHYSIGIQMFNLYYDLSYQSKWQKNPDINSFFLPQFSLYQKLDLKIFKVLYFSVIFNFTTLPVFYFDGSALFSRPFYYDFFSLEISFIGFSILI